MAENRYLLAFDAGTTSVRTLVLDFDGQIVAHAQRRLAQHFPQPGYVEHDLDEIYDAQLDTARAAMMQAGVSAGQVAGIGIANQRETVGLWERATGRPLHRAIVWQDRRTADHCARLRADGLEHEVQARTGLLLDPYFSATKLRYLLVNVPYGYARAEKGELAAGTVDSWLLWRLTGGAVHATDATNASRTALMNLSTRRWDEELLRIFQIPANILPEIRPNIGLFGETRAFGDPIPILAMAGDQQAALFGHGCVKPGMVKNTYGTGCFLMMHTGDTPPVSQHRMLATLALEQDGKPVYALEAAIFDAAAALEWLVDSGIFLDLHAALAAANSVRDTGGAVFVPAFSGLGAPYWDPAARGVITGLTRGVTRTHLARAAVEAMAFMTDDALRAMRADAAAEIELLRVDGGAAGNDGLMQLQADVSDLRIERPSMQEATAWGAAMLAGEAAGLRLPALPGDARFAPADAGVSHHMRTAWKYAVTAARGGPCMD